MLYISLHRHDDGNFFPGSGAVDEVTACSLLAPLALPVSQLAVGSWAGWLASLMLRSSIWK